MSIKLSFVILNYNSIHLLRLCITHIESLSLRFSYEIIVVDNASRDGSVTMVRSLFPTVTVIEHKQNIGHSAGNNAGIAVARGEIIALINPDIIFRNKTDIEAILQYMDTHPRVGILGPKIFNSDGTLQYSCYRRYRTLTPIYRRTFFGKTARGKRDISRHLMTDFSHTKTRDVEWLLGACLFVRKKTIDEIGRLNEAFFLYFGDYEWCDRARLHHWQVIYFHGTTGIVHYHKRESASHRLSLLQIISYVTRVHIKDWITYLRLSSPYVKT